MLVPRRTLAAIVVAMALVAVACNSGADEPAPETAVDRPTPAPSPTPRPEPRSDPDGNPIPEAPDPARTDVRDPSAELADVEPVEVAMLSVPEPTPTPGGFTIPTPTPTAPPEQAPGDEVTDGTETPTPTPVELPTAEGPDGIPIRVAGVVTATIGPLEIHGDACHGARARFERANRDLELDRPIRMVDCLDDRGDPDRNRQLVDQLTDDGRIFAVVPATSIAFFADDLLAERHIPYFGAGGLPAFCGFANGFGFGQTGALGCPALAAATTPVVAVPHLELYAMATGTDVDGLDVAVVRADTIAGELLAASVELEADLLGADVVLDSVAVPAGVDAPRSAWDDVVDEILDADPDLVVVDGDRTEGLYARLRVDFDGDVIGTGYADPAAFLDDPDLLTALAGSYQISQGMDPFDRSTASWGRFRLDAAAIGLADADLGLDALSGYAAADLFVEALAITPEPLTPESLHNVVNNGWQYPGIDDLLCAGWWPASHVVPYPCAAVAQVSPLDGPLRPVVPLTHFDLVVRTPAERAADE